MSKKIKLFFLSSLILNVVFISMFLGHSFRRHSMKIDHDLLSFIEKTSFSDTDKEKFKIKIEKNLPHKHHKRSERSKHRKQMIEILTDKEFNALEYKKHMSSIFEKHNKHRFQMMDVIGEIASKLSQNERKKLAKIF
jgi:hypothetical protein